MVKKCLESLVAVHTHTHTHTISLSNKINERNNKIRDGNIESMRGLNIAISFCDF